MFEVKIIIVSLLVLDFWFNEAKEITLLRNLLIKINRKPFNCTYCLSFWIGIIISVISLNPVYLLIPLVFKVLNK